MQRLTLRLALLSVCVPPLLVQSAAAEDAEHWFAANRQSVVDLYYYLHQNPELSFHEEKTSGRLADEWRAVGVEVTQNVGGFGVVGLLRNGQGPTLMLRTDLDALPVAEDTGLPYASKVRVEDERGEVVGVMHACGHDIHISNLVAVARYMASNKDRWRGTLMLVGQPAEERGAGAAAMLKDGLFTRFPKPDFAVALHVDSLLAAGKVSLHEGFSMANVDSVDITIHGRGGHGAYPHTTIDPIVIAARLVLDLQTIVSREIKPIEPAVVTVGSIQGGTKHNIIGDICTLQLTVRSYSDEVRAQLKEAIERKTKAAAASSGAPDPEISFSEGTPSLYNDPQLAARIRGVFNKKFGEDNVESGEPSMGGEDFSRYGRAGSPILMYRVGAVRELRLEHLTAGGGQPPSLHSPQFYPDPDPTLETAFLSMTAAALEIMAPGP